MSKYQWIAVGTVVVLALAGAAYFQFNQTSLQKPGEQKSVQPAPDDSGDTRTDLAARNGEDKSSGAKSEAKKGMEKSDSTESDQASKKTATSSPEQKSSPEADETNGTDETQEQQSQQSPSGDSRIQDQDVGTTAEETADKSSKNETKPEADETQEQKSQQSPSGDSRSQDQDVGTTAEETADKSSKNETKPEAQTAENESTESSKDQSEETQAKENQENELPPGDTSLNEILKKIDKIRGPSKQFSSKLEVVSKKGLKSGKIGQDAEWEETSTQRFELSVGSPTKSLVKFVYPPTDRGKFLLMAGDNLWFYTQKTRNPIRITPQQRLIGQVSNGDVARVVFSAYYKAVDMQNATIDRRDQSGQIDLYKLKLEAKDVATYEQIDLFVQKENYRPYRADFYSVSGKRLKTAYYMDYEPVLGHNRPTRMRIIDQLRDDQVSTMKYSNFQEKDFPSHYFKKSYLQYHQ